MKHFFSSRKFTIKVLIFSTALTCVSAYVVFSSSPEKKFLPKKQKFPLSTLQNAQAPLSPALSKSWSAPLEKKTGELPTRLNVTRADEIPLSVAEEKKSQEIRFSFSVNGARYDVSVPKNSSVYSAMNVLERSEIIHFNGKEFSGLGFFVEEINGVKNDYQKGMYWIYYVNGKKANVGISSYIVSYGDVIEWKYESNQ